MRAQLETELAEEHELLAGGLDKATALGFVDEIVSPQLTRSAVARAISSSPAVRGRHGNIPL